jgi:hypothetical protein
VKNTKRGRKLFSYANKRKSVGAAAAAAVVAVVAVVVAALVVEYETQCSSHHNNIKKPPHRAKCIQDSCYEITDLIFSLVIYTAARDHVYFIQELKDFR